jgi:hypothetical protein
MFNLLPHPFSQVVKICVKSVKSSIFFYSKHVQYTLDLDAFAVVG